MATGGDDTVCNPDSQPNDEPFAEVPVEGDLETPHDECHPPDDRDVDQLPPQPDNSLPERVNDVDFESPRDRRHPIDDRDVDQLPPPPDDHLPMAFIDVDSDSKRTERHPADNRDIDHVPPKPHETHPDGFIDVDFEGQRDECHPQDDRDVDQLPPPRDEPPEEVWNGAAHAVGQKSRFHLLTVDEILQLPPPRWLVRGLLEERSLSVLYGPSGDGNSFVALDIAASVATGIDWLGRKVTPGAVVYVIGDGGRSIVKRVETWFRAHQVGRDNLYFVCQSVQVTDKTELAELAMQIKCKHLKPALIVFDTFARCFVGGDETSTKDVGTFVAAIREFQREIGGDDDKGGTAVLIVHHTGQTDEDIERDSRALRAVADTMILLKKKDDALTLICNEEEDSGKGDQIPLRREMVPLGFDEDEAPISSMVVRARVAEQPAAAGPKRRRQNPIDQTALAILEEHGQLHSSNWRKLVETALKAPVVPSTFVNVRLRLVQAGLVEPVVGVKDTYRFVQTSK